MNAPRGYTLIELIVATASASVLMVGLSSALFVSVRALEMDNGATLQQCRAEHALSRLMADLGEATRFETATTTTLSFYVPDRNDDGLEELIGYSWSGVAGDPLMHAQSGRTAILLKDVTSLDFRSVLQNLTALDVTVQPPPPWPIVESTSLVEVDPKSDSLTLPAPNDIEPGEFLLAAVAIHNDRKDSLSPPAGWSVLDLNVEDGKVTLGVWWKIATSSEPTDYTWTWSGDEEAIGVGLRISNQYAGNPITSFAVGNGNSTSPGCPTTGVTLDNSLIVRLGGFHKDKVGTAGETGLIDHTDVYMDEVSKDVSLGVGHRVQEAAGNTGVANFVLTSNEEYRSLTVVIAPEQQ